MNTDMNKIFNTVISAYDTIADAYAEAYSDNDETDFEYFNCFFEHLPGKRILDMGCGVGTNANLIAKKGYNVIGVDASENMLKNAKRFYPNLVFEQYDILRLPYPDKSFDGIVLAYVIEHFNADGLVQLKKEITRLLVDGGLLYITSHEGNSEEIIPDPLDDNVSIYYNFISVETIKELFSDFTPICIRSRASYGPEEFLNDKYFITLKKEGRSNESR